MSLGDRREFDERPKRVDEGDYFGEKPEPESLVPAPVAGMASLLIPGLGQLLARRLRRGLLLMGSIVTLVILLIWRLNVVADRAEDLLDAFGTALARLPFFVGILTLGIIVLWLWNAWDAYRQAEGTKRGGIAIFALVLLLFFTLGWQISRIDPYTAVTEFSDVWPLLSRVLWPWPAAVTREVDMIEASAPIQVPCPEEGEPPEPPEPDPDDPYIIAEPTCGQLSELGPDGEVLPGNELAVVGENFRPNTETQIRWQDPAGNEFRIRQAGDYVTVETDDEGSFTVDVTMPYRLLPPGAEADIHQIIARQNLDVGPLVPSEALTVSIVRMVETIFLGMMATLFGIVFAIPVSFLAARNLMSGSWLTLGIYYVTRTVLNITRAIEPLIWVIIAAQWVGLGPFAGILALTIHTIAALGKLYSEAIEGIDPGPIEAIQATGATQLQTIMYGVIPQMIPPFVSFSIYRWDINVRLSTVVGLVGGGGIGFILIQYIRLLNFRAAGIAVWFIAITVAILDYVSAEIRERYV